MSGVPLLRVERLSVRFPVRGAAGGQLRALDDVSFELESGQTIGIVGESGCGKSTLARALLRLVPIAGGRVEFEGRDYTRDDDVALRPLRRAVRLVFQDPLASLNPRFTIGQSIREPLEIFEPDLSRSERERAVCAALERVGLAPGYARRYPHELSGGQNQRVSIARALVGGPRLIVCDESVSALDVSVQAQILNLLEDMKQRYGLTLVFVAHDLAVVKNVSDRVAVMYLGKMCEIGPPDDLYRHPAHPYTAALLAAIPLPDPSIDPTATRHLGGELPSPIDPPSGCRFRTRCDRAQELCAQAEPQMQPVSEGHHVACHFPLETPVEMAARR